HLAAQPRALYDLATDRLERASKIADLEPAQPGNDPAGDPGDPGSLAAPPAHDVVPGVDLRDELRDVVRVVLHVAVHEHEQVAAAVVDARLDSGGLAEVAPEADHALARLARRQLSQAFGAAVGAAVVVVQDLERGRTAIENSHELARRGPDAVQPVVYGQSD